MQLVLLLNGRLIFIFYILVLISIKPILALASDESNFQAAVERYRERINQDPKNLDLHREMILYAAKTNRINVPLHIYKNIQAKQPNNPLFCYLLAYTYFHSKHSIEQAIDLAKKTLSHQNNFWQASQLLGECYTQTGNTKLAEEIFLQAVEAHTDAWPIKLQLAKLYQSQQAYLRALTYYRQLSSNEPKSASIHFEIGLILRHLKRLPEAQSAFQRSIRHDKKYVSAHYQIGQIYALQKRPNKAIDQYRRARKFDPAPKPKPRYELAAIFLKQEDGRNAILALRSGISLDSKYANYTNQFQNVSTLNAAKKLSEILTNLPIETEDDCFLHFFVAHLHIKTEQFETARWHLEQIISLQPNHAESHALLGQIYEQSNMPEAINAFEQAVEYGNEKVEIMLKLAQNYQRQKKNDKFVVIAERILALSQHPEIHYQLALYYEEQALTRKEFLEEEAITKLEEKALYHVDQAVKINPESAKYNLKLGSYYDQRKKLKAIRFYEKAIQLDPQNPEGYYKRGLFMSNYTFGAAKVLLYAPEDVMADLTKSIQLDPNSIGAHRAMGIVYDRMYDVPNAIKSFKRVIQLNPQDSYAQIYLAEKYANSGQIQLAVSALEQAIKGSPSDVEALKDYAFLSLKLNQELLWKKAKKALETANKIRPDDAEILMNYGYTLYLSGEIEKSVEQYKKSIQQKPDWDITYYNLALAYERLRKYDLAKQSYQKVSEINPNGPLNNKSINRLILLEGK